MKIVAVFFLMLASATGASAQGLSRSQAVAQALAANPTIKLSLDQVALLEGRIVEAKADALPEISWNTGLTRFRDPSLLNSPGFDEFPPEFRDALAPIAANAFATTADVRQTLFSFKLNKAIQAARAARIAGEQDTQRTRQVTALDAIRPTTSCCSRLSSCASFARTSSPSRRTPITRGTGARPASLPSSRCCGPRSISKMLRGIAAGRKRSCRRSCSAQHRDAAADDDTDPADRHAGGGAFRRGIRSGCRGSAHRETRAPAAAHAGACADMLIDVAAGDAKPSIDFIGSFGFALRRPNNFFNFDYSAWRASINVAVPLFDGWRTGGRVAQARAERNTVTHQIEALEVRCVSKCRPRSTPLRSPIGRFRRPSSTSIRHAARAT